LYDLSDVPRHLEAVGATVKSLTEPLDTTDRIGMKLKTGL
jgi:hypothetical protein